MGVSELDFASIADLGRLYRRREVSPVEVTERVLERADGLGRKLNAVITVMENEARAAARRAEAAFAPGGPEPGPLAGIPVSLKDLIWTAGVRTTAGSPIRRDHVPDRDATVVTRLRAAGAVLFAKANTLEFAYGVVHPEFGPALNPWNPEHSAGGSSSGSGVLVAAGVGCGSVGSDTGGSIRNPAAWCGTAGLKPTYGRVSRMGVYPLSWSLDHVGPLTRSAQDAALMLQAMAGYDPLDLNSADLPAGEFSVGDGSVSGLRLGLVTEAFSGCDQETEAAVRAAAAVLEGAGARVTEVEIPGWGEAAAGTYNIMSPEASSFHENWLRERPGDYSEAARKRLEVGMLQPAINYVRAQRYRTHFAAAMATVLEQVDLLVLPTMPFAAPRLDAPAPPPGLASGHITGRTCPFNLTGMPALSIPCGFSAAGLPLALQIAGRPWQEALVLQAAHGYQSLTDWHLRRPAQGHASIR